MDARIAVNQQIILTAAFESTTGAEAELDPKNPPRWGENSKETIVKLAEGDDPKSVVVEAVAEGIAEVTCLDPGSNKSDVAKITVVPAGVAKVTVAAGPVETKKAPKAVAKAPAAEKTTAKH